MLPESWIKEEKLEFKEERRASGVRGSGCTPPKYGALSLRIYCIQNNNKKQCFLTDLLYAEKKRKTIYSK
jgi:hypothetical protein